ncbi:MAG TPA: galactokinase family protein, partial [Desulfobacterales bacterium]|nr:galactokinase family protein [Desulfobacterales bacterium]
CRPSSRQQVTLGFVPGRIEVLGRHTDYAGGHSLVCAIDRGFLFAATRNDRGTVRMAGTLSEFEPIEFPAAASIAPSPGSWANYPMTMTQRLAANLGARGKLAGVDVAFSSTLPVGSGMSGSSALMMMTFLALAEANGLARVRRFQAAIADGVDLAMYLACCENGQSFRGLAGNRGVGTFGGSEDHTAILNGRAGMLSLFQYAPTVHKADLSWPAEHLLVVCFSGVRAEKTKAALERYNLASRRARDAAAACNAAWGTEHENLRGVLDHAESHHGGRAMLAVERALVDTPRELRLAGRVRQFALEDHRYLPEAERALCRRDMRRFGRMIDLSHAASRRYLGNIVPQVDFLQRTAGRLGAHGASGFGAGFGGAVFAVVPESRVAEFAARWEQEYQAAYPRESAEARFFPVAPADGMRSWDGTWSGRWVDRVFHGR